MISKEIDYFYILPNLKQINIKESVNLKDIRNISSNINSLKKKYKDILL